MNVSCLPSPVLRRRTRIKFCGMRREADVRVAVALGVDAVGFVCVPESPRCVGLREAVEIRRSLPPFVACIALLRNPDVGRVEAVIDRLAPDLLQFHGEEDAAFCRRFGRPYLKAIAMGGAPPRPEELASYHDAAALLLDGHPPGTLGGQGRAFDWNLAGIDTRRSLILAGGLTPENVADAVARLRPYAVDVSSGIESGTPGVKDSGKMSAFVGAVHRADALAATGP